MLRRAHGAILITLVAAVALGSACSEPNGPASPAAPTTTGGGTAGASGATIAGSVNGTSAGLERPSGASTAMTVSVVGTSLSSTVDMTGRFELTGVPTGDVQLRFTTTGIDAHVTIAQVAEQERIEIRVSVSSTGATIENQQRTGPNNKIEIEGIITEIDDGLRTLVVAGKTVSVPPEATIRHGSRVLGFTDLDVGNRIHVKATLVDTVITAQIIDLQNPNPEPGEVELSGFISGLTGSCPALTFTLGTTVVKTTSLTSFVGDTCMYLVNNVAVDVRGVLQSDGSVTALKVEPEILDVEGTVSGLGGTCPALTFTAGGKSVTTNANTTFVGGTCNDVSTGDKVEVKGLLLQGGGIVAMRVKIEDGNMTQDLEGLITAINTGMLTFVVDGTVTVTVTPDTIIRHGSLRLVFADLKVGYRVHVKGTRSGMAMTATQIEVQNDNPTPPTPEASLSGSVSNVTGACPKVSFTVSSTVVTTSPLTTYAGGGGCGDLKTDAKVELKGLKQPDNSVAASWIKFDNPGNGKK